MLYEVITPQGLAAARGHDGQGIAARENPLDYVPLEGAEFGVAEYASQYSFRIGIGGLSAAFFAHGGDCTRNAAFLPGLATLPRSFSAAGIPAAVRGRITSYNVCYTKLLRHQGKVARIGIV